MGVLAGANQNPLATPAQASPSTSSQGVYVPPHLRNAGTDKLVQQVSAMLLHSNGRMDFNQLQIYLPTLDKKTLERTGHFTLVPGDAGKCSVVMSQPAKLPAGQAGGGKGGKGKSNRGSRDSKGGGSNADGEKGKKKKMMVERAPKESVALEAKAALVLRSQQGTSSKMVSFRNKPGTKCSHRKCGNSNLHSSSRVSQALKDHNCHSIRINSSSSNWNGNSNSKCCSNNISSSSFGCSSSGSKTITIGKDTPDGTAQCSSHLGRAKGLRAPEAGREAECKSNTASMV